MLRLTLIASCGFGLVVNFSLCVWKTSRGQGIKHERICLKLQKGEIYSLAFENCLLSQMSLFEFNKVHSGLCWYKVRIHTERLRWSHTGLSSTVTGPPYHSFTNSWSVLRDSSEKTTP